MENIPSEAIVTCSISYVTAWRVALLQSKVNFCLALSLQVDYKKQSLYLAGILRHMTTEEMPVLLANHRARLEEHSGSAANTLAKRTHLPVIKRLLQKGRHLAQHSMRKVSCQLRNC